VLGAFLGDTLYHFDIINHIAYSPILNSTKHRW